MDSSLSCRILLYFISYAILYCIFCCVLLANKGVHYVTLETDARSTRRLLCVHFRQLAIDRRLSMVVATLIARINVLFRATGRRHQLPVVHRCKKRSRKKYKVRKRKKRGKNKKKF